MDTAWSYLCPFFNYFRSVWSRLQSDGIKIPFERVRESLLRVDAAAVALRMGNTVHRRCYNVTQPNRLWHFDGKICIIKKNPYLLFTNVMVSGPYST